MLGSLPGAPTVPAGFQPWGIVGAVASRPVAGWVWPVAITSGILGGFFVLEEIDDDEPVSPVIP